MRQLVIPGHPEFLVYESGPSPRLLIHSGTHGDECEVIPILKQVLEEYESFLPPFLYVPHVSPTAVAQKTRVNARGLDMNRIFWDGNTEPEVLLNIQIMQGRHFDLFVDFHQDFEFESFYVYDVSKHPGEDPRLKSINQKLKDAGIELFSGIDDPNDPFLGYQFVEGSYKSDQSGYMTEEGMIDLYFLKRNLVERAWIVEVPGLLSLDKKRLIVENIIRELMIPSV